MKNCCYLLFLFTFVSCQRPNVSISTADVQALMNKWEKAYIHKDTSLLAVVLHDEYLYAGNADGSRATKEQVINELYSSDYQILKVVFEELDIQCFGGTAIVRGNELIYLLLASGDTLQVPLSFTDVYQKQNGITRALATHSSPRE